MDSSGAFGSSTPFAEPLWYSRTDNPNYTDSHRRLRQAIRRYVDTELIPFVSEWEEKGAVPQNVRFTLRSLDQTYLPSEAGSCSGFH